jgi:hypothetical protein
MYTTVTEHINTYVSVANRKTISLILTNSEIIFIGI